MTRSLGYIFWGLILVILDFKINGIDLLPDIVGYPLIAVGAVALHRYSPKFSLAGSLCWMLAIGWVIGLFLPIDAALGHGLLMTALNLAMIWSLLGGIIDLARSKDRPDLAEMAHNRRVAYVAIFGGVTLISIAAQSHHEIVAIAAIAAVIAMVVLLVLILRLIHRMRYEISA